MRRGGEERREEEEKSGKQEAADVTARDFHKRAAAPLGRLSRQSEIQVHLQNAGGKRSG